MFIWLKDPKGEFTCETAREWLKKQDAAVQWDQKRAQSYVSVTFHGGLMDPTTECPCIPDELVTHVTHREDVVGINCYRKEGVYKTANASIVVSSWLPSANGEPAQLYAISAISVAAAKELYCKVRRGEMLPVEDWTAKQIAPAPTTESTAPVNPFPLPEELRFDDPATPQEGTSKKEPEHRSPLEDVDRDAILASPKRPARTEEPTAPVDGHWELRFLRPITGTAFSHPVCQTLAASTAEEARMRCAVAWRTIIKTNQDRAHSPELVFVYKHDCGSMDEAEIDRLLDAHGKSAPGE